MAKLKPRARLIRTIGDKLISGPEAAIIELVKNSYDADSASVDIKITPPLHQKNVITLPVIKDGEIVITDDGHGMTYDEIIGIWLEPATDSKTKKSTSRSGKRQVLGAKGVGRFATASLGKTIELTSIAFNNGILEKSQLTLDWEVFETVKYLEDIDININKCQLLNTDTKTGISIKVKNLNDIWGQERLKTLIQELRRLATPTMSDEFKFKISFDLESFTISENNASYLQKIKDAKKRSDVDFQPFSPYDFDGVKHLYENNKTLKILQGEQQVVTDQYYENKNTINPYSLGEHCDYFVKGHFDEHGEFKGELRILRGDKKSQVIALPAINMDVNHISCSSFDIELKLFDLEPNSIKRLFKEMGLNYNLFSLKEARKFITENTGIAIYRNSFRVRPYGHHDHDWLNLEKRRVQDPSHKIGHGQISGSIRISNEEVSNLIERSSREGLEQNGAFYRLRDLVTELLKNVEAVRHNFRNKAQISRPPKKDFEAAIKLASLDKVSAAINSVHALSSEDREKIQSEVNKTSKDMDNVLKGMKRYLQLLESRAALGGVVAEVLHEGRSYLTPIKDAKNFLVDFGDDLTELNTYGDDARKELPLTIKCLDDGVRGISNLFDDIDPVSGRKRGKPESFNICAIIDTVVRLTKTPRSENEVFIENNVNESLEIHGFKGDLQAALLNLVINATHWLGTELSTNRLITINSELSNNKMILKVSNNGPSINDVHIEHLFDAGFSLKTNGHGLGLVIAREALRNSNGNLIFDPNNELTTFIIDLPEAIKVK
jgi:signal transduction histidine kinase